MPVASSGLKTLNISKKTKISKILLAKPNENVEHFQKNQKNQSFETLHGASQPAIQPACQPAV